MISNKPLRRIDISKKKYDKRIPDLLEAQVNSYNDFLSNGIKKLFSEINPIEDYTKKLWSIEFFDHKLGEPKVTFKDALRLNQSYDAPLYIKARLLNKQTGEIKEQELFVADVPLMNERGTFAINGVERSVVMQIVRSEGVLFVENTKSTSEKLMYSVKLMPERGYWYEFEVNKYDVMSIKLVDKRPKILLTTLLRAYGFSTDDEIRALFKDLEVDKDKQLVETTLLKDRSRNREEALIEIYHKLKPDESITLEAAEEYIKGFFFDDRKFYLGTTGRYKLNKKLELDSSNDNAGALVLSDMVAIIRALVKLNQEDLAADDVDHLANRRIRGVGELIETRMRVGVRRMEKNIKDRMSTFGGDELLTPITLVSTRPVTASLNEFFGSSAVSRYMDKENILSEIESKRRITAGGPGGLTKERATFSVRDVHSSHYGRLCPIETPEGPHIGIVSHMAMYSRINKYGFLETPYNKVLKMIDPANDKEDVIVGRILAQDVKGLGKAGYTITKSDVSTIKKMKDAFEVKPFITDERVYFDADEEDKHRITLASIDQDEAGNITAEVAAVRFEKNFGSSPASEVEYIDVDPSQIAGLSLSLVPYVANTDSNRALMASNMQRQSVPLLKPEAPIVGTGMEELIARESGYSIYAKADGEVTGVDASFVEFSYDENGKKKKEMYLVDKYARSNQNTCFNQNVKVSLGQKVKKGELLVDGASTDKGEIALGTNITVAYMFYEGFNYEDGVIVSERLVKDDVLTSIHIKEHTQDIRDTKLGPEQITRDIPNVSEYALRNLDDEGVVRVGAKVGPQDILVGIIAPKGETELSAEEKLLRAIFGEYARDVRDNSLKMPHGDNGVVVNVQVLDKAKGDKLNPGVLKQVKVWVARTHKIGVGDKIAGRYGDKNVIAKVLPEEDLPYLEDGTPVDIVLSPIFIKRMNIGQLKETHMAALVKALGINVAVPVFTPYDETIIEDMVKEKKLDVENKLDLYDGRTGEMFDRKVTVGPRYIMKLNHLAADKVHTRSTGPYTLVTQQPLGGKAQFGGQRFGEMEVWALEAHGVPYVLQEMLTIKSDDVIGRADAYKSIIQGELIKPPRVPESFKVLISELQSMALSMEQVNVVDEETTDEDDEDDKKSLEIIGDL